MFSWCDTRGVRTRTYVWYTNNRDRSCLRVNLRHDARTDGVEKNAQGQPPANNCGVCLLWSCSIGERTLFLKLAHRLSKAELRVASWSGFCCQGAGLSGVSCSIDFFIGCSLSDVSVGFGRILTIINNCFSLAELFCETVKFIVQVHRTSYRRRRNCTTYLPGGSNLHV